MRRGRKYFRLQIEFLNNACQIKLIELHVAKRHDLVLMKLKFIIQLTNSDPRWLWAP